MAIRGMAPPAAFPAAGCRRNVMTGLGGGSPRNVPSVIAPPDIGIPQSGRQARYVFAWP